jgi:hypothetical protein
VAEFLLLMHRDGGPEAPGAWEAYIGGLITKGVFAGGSSLGRGQAVRKGASPALGSAQLAGFLRVTAPSLEAALKLVEGNPTHEAGGTVEVRELVED